MTIEVIGAGWGRTATNSLKLALERLGFGVCHHMWEVANDQERLVPLWNAALDGNPDGHVRGTLLEQGRGFA